MLIAIDTATRTASLAIHDGRSVLYETTWQAGWRHTVQSTSRLVAAMDSLALDIESLSGVAVSLGPGSFTGLRVGMALAKGLVLARNIPLVGIPTLDVLAVAQGRDRRPLMAVLQAGRGRICVATYRWRKGWQQRGDTRLTTWKELAAELDKPALFCGEIDDQAALVLKGMGDLATVLPPAYHLRRAGFMAELAWARIREDDVDNPETLIPIYLHQPN
jgi:tRNA threonylcarbamoyladenosine biosynthesis protein TsaB